MARRRARPRARLVHRARAILPLSRGYEALLPTRKFSKDAHSPFGEIPEPAEHHPQPWFPFSFHASMLFLG